MGSRMRVGSDYQAVVPHISTVLEKPAPKNTPEEAILIWSPNNDIPDEKLDEYIQLAKDKYNYNMEQALGILCWHKHDISKALADMPNFTPLPDEWTVEDKVLFEQAFQFHDKHFQKIKQMLPDKSLASLVKYYYSWKKTRSRTSLMDRQVKKLNTQKDESDAASDAGSEQDSDAAGQSLNGHNSNDATGDSGEARTCSTSGSGNSSGDRSADGQKCENCQTNQTAHFHQTTKGVLCRACYSFWRRTGLMRLHSNSRSAKETATNSNNSKSVRKPPRGMYISLEDVVSMAKGPAGQAEAILRNLDQEVVEMKRQVQNNKQIISQLKQKNAAGIEDMRITEVTFKPNPRWTTEEQSLAVQAFRKYGKDFKAISELLGTKTEMHIRNFYINNDKKFNLSAIVKEYQEQQAEALEQA